MSDRLDRARLAALLDIDEGFIAELESHEVVVCDERGCYDYRSVERVRISYGMARDLGVNMAGLHVALDLLERWQAERRRVRELLERLRDDDDAP